MKLKKKVRKRLKMAIIWTFIWLFLIILIVFISYWKLWGWNDLLDESNTGSLTQTTDWKQDFYIETKKFKDFNSSLSIEKVWRLNSSQGIDISSNAVWRIAQIRVREWDRVVAWQVLAVLSDTIWNYFINLERARNTLEKARLSYETTENQLNKSISDLKINLNNSELDNPSSSKSLELKKIEDSINKLNIDLNNLIASNKETLSWFNLSLWKEVNTYRTFSADVIDFADKLLSVTFDNKDENKSFRDFLWAEDVFQKKQSEEKLKDLIEYNKRDLLSVQINLENLEEYSIYITTWYDKISKLLSSIETTLDNSIPSEWAFSNLDITTKKNAVNSFEISYNSFNSQFIWLKNSINSFLATYKNSEESLRKQLTLLEWDKDIFVRSLDVKLEIDNSSLDEAIKNRDLTLRNLERNIVDAQIAYASAQKEYSKLTITSPISWTVWNVLWIVWQEVANWVKLFSILNNKNKEVEIFLNKDEVSKIKLWWIAYVDYEESSFAWIIYSISNVADTNLNYKVKISLSDDISLIWDIVNVRLLYISKTTLLPINIVSVWNDNKWTINVYNSWSIDTIEIWLWNIHSDMIEIVQIDNVFYDIIINDVSNFDKEKFRLKLK